MKVHDKNTHFILRDSLEALSAFIDDPGIQEIMLNVDGSVWLERLGKVFLSGVRFSLEQLSSMAILLLHRGKRMASDSLPISYSQLDALNLRFCVIAPPVSSGGYIICIRKGLVEALSFLDILIEQGISHQVSACLLAMIEDRKNILISGGVSSGKTTLLSAMLAVANQEDRVIVIEDSEEIRIKHKNHVRIFWDPRNSILVSEVARAVLRLRADRIVFGEIRGGDALEALKILNTGHRGCFGTIHANHAQSALLRISSLALSESKGLHDRESIYSYIAEGIDCVIHLEKTENKRMIKEVFLVEAKADCPNGIGMTPVFIFN